MNTLKYKNGISFCTLKNENQLRQLRFLTVCTSAKNHHLPFRPRWINYIYAKLNRYFWLDCHLCGQEFGGHECYGSSGNRGICPSCVLKRFNETGSFYE